MQLPDVNRVDIPAVWAIVALDFFTKLPWPGIAAFFAAVYTLLRIIQMVWRWKRGRK